MRARSSTACPEEFRVALLDADRVGRLLGVLDLLEGTLGCLDERVHLPLGDEVEVVASGRVGWERQPRRRLRDALGEVAAADLAHRAGVDHRQDEAGLLRLVARPAEREDGDRDDCLLADLFEEVLQFPSSLRDVADEPADEVEDAHAEAALPRAVDDDDERVRRQAVQRRHQHEQQEVLRRERVLDLGGARLGRER